MVKQRYIVDDLVELCFDANKMAFVSGPRQGGKTTMAKALLVSRGEGGYFNWDETKFRRLWAKDPATVIPTNITAIKPLVILDEIHKAKLWKRSIKGIFDTLSSPCDILVTGSAKLNVYRKGSDSLLGRYHHFRLHPFSYGELLHSFAALEPELWLDQLFQNAKANITPDQDLLQQLNQFGPFPEPFLAKSKRTLLLWQRTRIERLIREDLRDLSRIPELSRVEMLASLLPERVGYPININSIREDFEVSHNTIKRWLDCLKSLYYHYEVKPYSKSLPRALKKEGKLYLWDWSEVEDPGARFENLIASHLLKFSHYMHDTGYGSFELNYVRNKEKKEIDFLIMKNKKPWLPIEVKLNDEYLSSNWDVFMGPLKCKQGIQIVQKSNVFKIIQQNGYEILIISANEFLKYFP